MVASEEGENILVSFALVSSVASIGPVIFATCDALGPVYSDKIEPFTCP